MHVAGAWFVTRFRTANTGSGAGSQSDFASVINGPSTELLQQLTDDIGARLVGSPAYERAAQWAAARFRAAGLTNVRFEEFTLPNGWQRGPAHARILAPVTRSLRVGSVGWGPSTPPGGIRGDLILISDLSPVTLRSQSAQLKNRIVLVDLEKALPSDEPLAFARLRDSYAMLSDLGVQAVLLPHDVPITSPAGSTLAMRVARSFRFPSETLGGKTIFCCAAISRVDAS